jgi:protein phosphatase 1L
MDDPQTKTSTQQTTDQKMSASVASDPEFANMNDAPKYITKNSVPTEAPDKIKLPISGTKVPKCDFVHVIASPRTVRNTQVNLDGLTLGVEVIHEELISPKNATLSPNVSMATESNNRALDVDAQLTCRLPNSRTDEKVNLKQNEHDVKVNSTSPPPNLPENDIIENKRREKCTDKRNENVVVAVANSTTTTEQSNSTYQGQNEYPLDDDWQLTYVPGTRDTAASSTGEKNITSEYRAKTSTSPPPISTSTSSSRTRQQSPKHSRHETETTKRKISSSSEKKKERHISESPRHRTLPIGTSSETTQQLTNESNTDAISSETNHSPVLKENFIQPPSNNNNNNNNNNTTNNEEVHIMSAVEAEELERLRQERQGGRKRQGAFYAPSSKVGRNIDEKIDDAPSSLSGAIIFSSLNYVMSQGRNLTKSDMKIRVHKTSSRLIVGFADTIGRRPTMEDDFVIHGQFGGFNTQDFIAILDGHAGSEAAQLVAEHLPAFLQRHMKKNHNIPQCFKQSFQDVNAFLKKRGVFGGTTVLACLILQNEMFIANLGDCRAVACQGYNQDSTKAIRLTRDHRPDSPEEQQRIEKLGGEVTTSVTKEGKVVSRVNGVLGVSRALGDFDLEPLVNAEPEIFSFTLNDEKRFKFIICACDGLWDVVTDQEAVDIALPFMKEHKIEQACQRLRNVAYARGSTDNITVIIVEFLRDDEIPAVKHLRNGGRGSWCNVL